MPRYNFRMVDEFVSLALARYSPDNFIRLALWAAFPESGEGIPVQLRPGAPGAGDPSGELSVRWEAMSKWERACTLYDLSWRLEPLVKQRAHDLVEKAREEDQEAAA